ncbi:hypothetical protein ACH5RR_033935 [Cinchona calisaya]|uniref:Myb/SANT-like domain-containing protein n=1 Tax=Cinchona calisaya TaxID=153742 RepID=A0ABD2YD78_9GENT
MAVIWAAEGGLWRRKQQLDFQKSNGKFKAGPVEHIGSCAFQIDSKFRGTSGSHTVSHHHIRLPPSTTCICPCHSSSASNDFKLSLRNYFKMADKPKWKWNDEHEFKFFSTYVEWKLNGQWDRSLLTRQNYNKLAQFLNETYGMVVTADILSSKYYRLFEKWKVYNELRGICKQATTGVSYNKNNKCFMADDEQWLGFCQGQTTTGNLAHSSAQQPEDSLVRRFRRKMRLGRNTSTALGSGSGTPHGIFNPLSDDSNDNVNCSPQVSGKRPASSIENTNDSYESKNSNKTVRSGNQMYLEGISKFNRLAGLQIS